MVLKMNDLSGMVTRTEGICGGRPCVAGTRITISRIASFYHQGMSAEDIVSEHPHLTPAQVHAALAYYFANRDEIDRDLEAERDAFSALRQAHTVTPAA
jgi:uncharacterized protein (DUF433 family)